jgi:hypothetical protein
MGRVISAKPRALYPREWPSIHCIGGWVSSRAGLDGWGKSRPPAGFDARTVLPVAVAIPTHSLSLSVILISSSQLHLPFSFFNQNCVNTSNATQVYYTFRHITPLPFTPASIIVIVFRYKGKLWSCSFWIRPTNTRHFLYSNRYCKILWISYSVLKLSVIQPKYSHSLVCKIMLPVIALSFYYEICLYCFIFIQQTCSKLLTHKRTHYQRFSYVTSVTKKKSTEIGN